MIFSPPTQHALRALIYLANHEDDQPVHARVIAAAESIPSAFLSKILNRLRARGFLRSVMGPGGGYALSRPAREIRLCHVVEAFDDARDLGTRCLLGIGECGERGTCPLHERWNEFRSGFSRWIAALTLQEIAAPLATLAARSKIRERGGPEKLDKARKSRRRTPTTHSPRSRRLPSRSRHAA